MSTATHTDGAIEALRALGAEIGAQTTEGTRHARRAAIEAWWYRNVPKLAQNMADNEAALTETPANEYAIAVAAPALLGPFTLEGLGGRSIRRHASFLGAACTGEGPDGRAVHRALFDPHSVRALAARGALARIAGAGRMRRAGPEHMARALRRLARACERQQHLAGEAWPVTERQLKRLTEVSTGDFARLLGHPPWVVRGAIRRNISIEALVRRPAREGGPRIVRATLRGHAPGTNTPAAQQGVAADRALARWCAAWPFPDNDPPFQALRAWAREGRAPASVSDALWGAGAATRWPPEEEVRKRDPAAGNGEAIFVANIEENADTIARDIDRAVRSEARDAIFIVKMPTAKSRRASKLLDVARAHSAHRPSVCLNPTIADTNIGTARSTLRHGGPEPGERAMLARSGAGLTPVVRVALTDPCAVLTALGIERAVLGHNLSARAHELLSRTRALYLAPKSVRSNPCVVGIEPGQCPGADTALIKALCTAVEHILRLDRGNP